MFISTWTNAIYFRNVSRNFSQLNELIKKRLRLDRLFAASNLWFIIIVKFLRSRKASVYYLPIYIHIYMCVSMHGGRICSIKEKPGNILMKPSVSAWTEALYVNGIKREQLHFLLEKYQLHSFPSDSLWAMEDTDLHPEIGMNRTLLLHISLTISAREIEFTLEAFPSEMIL